MLARLFYRRMLRLHAACAILLIFILMAICFIRAQVALSLSVHWLPRLPFNYYAAFFDELLLRRRCCAPILLPYARHIIYRDVPAI